MSEEGYTANYEEARQLAEGEEARDQRFADLDWGDEHFADPMGELVVEGGECVAFEMDLSKRTVKEA